MHSRNLKQLPFLAGITDLPSISSHFHRPVSLQGKGLPEKQTKKNNWFISPAASVGSWWPCTGTAEGRGVLCRTEAPAGAGDSKYPAPNRSTPEVYNHVDSGERPY